VAEARALVTDKTDKDITVRHLISVEGSFIDQGGHKRAIGRAAQFHGHHLC
jgi:hypothetical protein